MGFGGGGVISWFFVRSGHVNSHDGYLNNAGQSGYGWSRTVTSGTSFAYNLNFGSGVDPSGNGYRYVGRSLRCLQE